MTRTLRRLAVGTVVTALVTPALVAGPVSPVVAATPSSSATPRATGGCATGLLPAEVLGSPGVKAGSATAVWFWYSGSRFHLRTTHTGLTNPSAPEGPASGARRSFKGTITSSGQITSVRGHQLEGGDKFSIIRPARKKVKFNFKNSGQLDGLSFKANCRKNITLKAQLDGAPVEIRLGADLLAIPPAAAPATFTEYKLVSNAVANPGCATGKLPAVVKGAPAGPIRQKPAGAWLYYKGGQYQLRVTHDQPGTSKVFTGSISSTTRLTDIKLVRAENEDSIMVRRPRPNLLTFEFRNWSFIDGLRFKGGCGNVTLTVSVDGAPAQINLGSTPTPVPLPAPPATASQYTVVRSGV